MSLEISFENQYVFVTGGSRGIGAELVKHFASAKANVIFTGTKDVAPDWLDALKRDFAEQKIDYHKLDIGSDNWEKDLTKIVDLYPQIDVCVNNAGINKVADIREINSTELRNIYEVNLLAPALIIANISQKMARKKYGRIVNIASIFGVVSRAGRSTYSATKAGLIGQTRACALDLAPDHILVNAVCPGFVLTDLTREILGEAGITEVAQDIPVGHLANPQDIVPAVLFLGSTLNTYITGQTLIVDGGYLAK